jgi:hypothetical protein
MLGEVIGDAADCVRFAAAQVGGAVAVEVHREAPVAARHELRDADGAGIGAFHAEHIEALLAHEQQVLLELAAERTPRAAGSRRRAC